MKDEELKTGTEGRGVSDLNCLLGGSDIYVLAGSYKQALDFAYENDIAPNKIRYLTNAESVMGIRGGYYAKVGTWYEKDNSYDMLNTLIAADFKDVTEKSN